MRHGSDDEEVDGEWLRPDDAHAVRMKRPKLPPRCNVVVAMFLVARVLVPLVSLARRCGSCGVSVARDSTAVGTAAPDPAPAGLQH